MKVTRAVCVCSLSQDSVTKARCRVHRQDYSGVYVGVTDVYSVFTFDFVCANSGGLLRWAGPRVVRLHGHALRPVVTSPTLPPVRSTFPYRARVDTPPPFRVPKNAGSRA